MPAVQCNCPSCQTLLQIAQAPPVQVGCPRCGSAFLVGPAAPQPPAAAPLIPVQLPAPPLGAPAYVPVPTPQSAAGRRGPRYGLPLALSAGLLVLLTAGVVVVVKLVSGGASSGIPGGGNYLSFDEKLDYAVQKGAAYLKKRLLDGSQLYNSGDAYGGGSDPGAVALAGLTLLECGVEANDPAVQQALATVREHAPTMGFTYSVAASVLFLDRLNDPKDKKSNPADRELIRRLALRLIANQNHKGGWAYRLQILTPEREQALLLALGDGRFTVASIFPENQQNGYDDNSIGQFCTLALWAARKHGIPVRTSLRAVDARYRRCQNPDGSWNYRANGAFMRDTSTCSALIGLAAARGAEDDGQPKASRPPPAGDILQDPVVQKGLRYLGGAINKAAAVTEEEQARRRQHTAELEDLQRRIEFALEADKPRLLRRMVLLDRAPELRGVFLNCDSWGDLYFLWSVERMAVIYDLKEIGGRDWHRWGAEVILANQKRDGSWAERFSGVPDTCFALLFLKRANVVKDLTAKLRLIRAGTNAAVAPAPGGAPPQPARKD